MPIAEADWVRAVAVLSGARQVAMACHVDPDGDALGSMLAFQRFLVSRGVDVVAGWGDDAPLAVPPQYTFLPGLEDLTTPSDFPAMPEVFMAFDCGSPDRLGSLRTVAENARTVVVVDHHASGSPFGDVLLLDGQAAATAVLVEELVVRMGGTLDRDMAICLYVALVTDTGRFQYACTTPAVMEMGARLIAHDIDHARINRQVWETHSFGYLKVLGRALERAALVPHAGLAWTAVTQQDVADTGISLAETEGLIDILRAVEAAECTCVAKEQPGGSWKVSLRSKGGVDVGRLAGRLGGGGHAYAGGFTMLGALEEVVGCVVALLTGQEAPVPTAQAI